MTASAGDVVPGPQEGLRGDSGPTVDEGASQRETTTQGVPKPRYAWCFSHGRMHTFYDDREPWCTANWAPLMAITEDGAEAEKVETWGVARFGHQLPLPDEQRLYAMASFRDSERKRLAP